MHCNSHLRQIAVTLSLIDQLCERHPTMTLDAANHILRSAVVVGSTSCSEDRTIGSEVADLWQSEAIQSHLPPW